MKNRKNEVPEIIMQASKYSVERASRRLEFFLLPLKAEKEIKKLKDLVASIEFMEGCSFEDWKEAKEVLYKIEEMYKNYPDYVKGNKVLTSAQQLILLNLQVVHNNARNLSNDASCEQFENETDKFYSVVENYAENALFIVEAILATMAVELPDEEICNVLLPRIYNINGKLLILSERMKAHTSSASE